MKVTALLAASFIFLFPFTNKNECFIKNEAKEISVTFNPIRKTWEVFTYTSINVTIKRSVRV